MVRRFQVTGDQELMTIQLPVQVLDSLMISQLADELLSFIEDQQPKRLVLDFSHVQRFSTEAIGLTLRIKKRVMGFKGQLRLAGMNRDIRHIYRLMRLDRGVLDISDSGDEAAGAC